MFSFGELTEYQLNFGCPWKCGRYKREYWSLVQRRECKWLVSSSVCFFNLFVFYTWLEWRVIKSKLSFIWCISSCLKLSVGQREKNYSWLDIRSRQTLEMESNQSVCIWAALESCNRQREIDVVQIWTLFLFVFRLIGPSVSSSTSIRTTHCMPHTHHHNWMTDGAMEIRSEQSTRILAMGMEGLKTWHVSSLRYIFITIFYSLLNHFSMSRLW